MAKVNKSDGVGRVYSRPNSPFLWVYYCHNGKVFRRSAETDSIKLANQKLQDLIKEVGQGSYRGGKAERIKVQELADDLVRNYKTKKHTSLPDLEARWGLHLKDFFGHYRVNDVSTSLVERYKEKRQAEQAADASINRELAALKRMYSLGKQSTPPKVVRVPYIEMLPEDNVREGYVEDDVYAKLADFCSGVGLWMRTMLELGYVYGLRVEAIKTLKVGRVNLHERVLVFPGKSMKNGKALSVKMTQKVFELLQQCCEGKQADDYVITRKTVDGRNKRIVDFRDRWYKACEFAGVPNLLFHDLRRTAARNLRRAGVPESIIMKIGNWKTRSVFLRYAGVNDEDLAVAMNQYERHQTERVLAQTLHTATKNEKAQPAKAELTH
jgi:integrase